MATGLAMPLGVGSHGGARIATGDENDDKIIRMALGDDANENAFQQNIGLGARQIFGASDDVMRAMVMRRCNEVFRRFEAQKRYRLRRETMQWSTDSETQEATLSFKYISLESDKELDFRQSFGR
jgi:hypothetical protein